MTYEAVYAVREGSTDELMDDVRGCGVLMDDVRGCDDLMDGGRCE